jgi:hypothetical protein
MSASDSAATAPIVAIDAAVSDSRSLGQLVANLKVVDPALAESLTAKPLAASKTVWGNAATLVLVWAATRYGFGLDADTCALVSGLAVMAATGCLRYISRSSIKGLIS